MRVKRIRTPSLWLVLLTAVCVPTAFGADLPTPMVTSGGDVWSSDPEIVCNSLAGDRRRTSASMKREAYAKYGIYIHRRGDYQVDHLIPLCLGGDDIQENLWPQSYRTYWNAAKKDQLERIICRRVCDEGNPYPLRIAQESIRENWIDLYEEVVLGIAFDSHGDEPCQLDEPDDDCP